MLKSSNTSGFKSWLQVLWWNPNMLSLIHYVFKVIIKKILARIPRKSESCLYVIMSKTALWDSCNIFFFRLNNAIRSGLGWRRILSQCFGRSSWFLDSAWFSPSRWKIDSLSPSLCVTLRKKNLKQTNKKNKVERQRQREISHLLVYYPNEPNSQSGTGQIWNLETQCRFPMWVARTPWVIVCCLPAWELQGNWNWEQNKTGKQSLWFRI